ncbi:MAG: histidine phosphatase family protein [Rubrimonas sp.]|uniref:histidine phosphatase family protein n=1 Tax=Rubrimonas sp. TaxID=2036015 RepID=UPI002FDDFD6A
MTALRWWWVRHAPTGAQGAIGWTDLAADLSDAAALGRLAAALPYAPVLSSDLARARTTAERLAGGRPLAPPDPGLRELHFGDWEGRGFDAIARSHPAESRAFWEAPGPSRAPGGESFDDLAARVAATVARVNAEMGTGDVIAVAHMGSIMAALAQAAGLSAAQALRFSIAPLSLTRLDWLPDARAWRVGAVNLTP